MRLLIPYPEKKNVFFRKAQIAMEFSIIIAFVIAIFVGFLYVLNIQITEIGLNEDKVAMRNLGDAIVNEVVMARQVHANYLRKFEIPGTLNGKNYSISMLDIGPSKRYGFQINLTG